ncbi:MAG: hypothetical protein LBG05_08740 [Treponema sp.]|jgi:hypothetical protein|nr:hypothetical protein [Treponema sp.]
MARNKRYPNREHKERKENKGKKEAENQQNRKNVDTSSKRTVFYDRPKWSPPQMSTESYPLLNCPYCGKLIRDLASAVTDKMSEIPVHLECIISKIAEKEYLEKGDIIAYIGGGRFGIVHFNDRSYLRRDKPLFTIKKVFEWENVENEDDRPAWRTLIRDHYSRT